MRYYYSTTGGDVQGPIPEETLKEMAKSDIINPHTQICEEGSDVWRLYSECFQVYSSATAVLPQVGLKSPVTTPPLGTNALQLLIVFIICGVGLYYLVTSSGTSGSSSSATQDRNTSAPQQAAPIGPIPAQDLAEAYNANKIAAEQKFNGRKVIVTGKVLQIGSMLGPYVVLGNRSVINGVQCGFSEKDNAELAKLNKGQIISVQGTVTGHIMNVLVSDCTFSK